MKLRNLLNESLDKIIQEIYSEDTKLPFLENRISEDESIRTFDKNTNENELKWHIDGEDRIVESIHKTDWMIQLDNNIPQRFEGKIKIKEGVYHRLIKGTNDLQLKIKKL